jgi:hypothetical protein
MTLTRYRKGILTDRRNIHMTPLEITEQVAGSILEAICAQKEPSSIKRSLANRNAIDQLILDRQNCYSTVAIYPDGVVAHNRFNFRVPGFAARHGGGDVRLANWLLV